MVKNQDATQKSHRHRRRDFSLGGGMHTGHSLGKGGIWVRRRGIKEIFEGLCLEAGEVEGRTQILTIFPQSQWDCVCDLSAVRLEKEKCLSLSQRTQEESGKFPWPQERSCN